MQGQYSSPRSAASLRDELSALFKSMGRDYMAGMKELIMQLYDCPDYLDSNTNNRGLVVIRDAALSILGAATPAELAVALTRGGLAQRHAGAFCAAHPGTGLRRASGFRRQPAACQPGARLSASCTRRCLRRRNRKRWAMQLPLEPWSLVATELWQPLRAYEQALRAMTAPNAPLDDRLRAVYGRLHVQALKVAIILAALDWIALGERRQSRPVVRAAHWYRAQEMAEDLAGLGPPAAARPGRERRSPAGNAHPQAADRTAGWACRCGTSTARCARRAKPSWKRLRRWSRMGR